MEATAALDTLHEQLHKAQQEYLRMLQQSFQLELDIPSCPETERVAKEEEQHKLDEVTEHTRKAMEQLQQCIDSFAIFLTSTSTTLGNSSTCNTTAAAASPPSPVPQISPIQSPCSSSPSPVDVSVNNTTASNSTHVASVPETQNNTITPSSPTQKKMPRLPPGLPKFNISKCQDPALHTIELEYHLNAYNYPEDRWMQALITTLVGDRRLWAISALRDQPWNVTLAKAFINSLIAFIFGRALLPHIKSKYKQQTLRNKPQDVIAAFELAVLIETEFPQPSSKDKGHSKSPQRQSQLPHTISAVCAHCKTCNHMEEQCQKKACKLQQQSSPATSATPALSSAPTTCNPTSTLPQQTCTQPSARQSSPSSRSLNSMSATQQPSNVPAPAAEQQDSIGDEEEYDEFYESQRALNSITITDDMPGPNDPICAPMTINGRRVTAVIDSGTSHSFMDPSIVDLVHAKTKQANSMVKLGHHETTATCAAEMEPLAIGFSEHHFHHMFSVLPQPDGQSIILGRDFMRKSSMGITDIPINYPEEPLPRSKDHNITQHQHQHLVKAVKEHICKHILEAIKKCLQENEALPTGPSCTLPEAVLYLDTGDHPPVFRHQYPIPHSL